MKQVRQGAERGKPLKETGRTIREHSKHISSVHHPIRAREYVAIEDCEVWVCDEYLPVKRGEKILVTDGRY